MSLQIINVTPTISRLRATLESGEVSRYHAVPTVRPQTDALHCWNMIALAAFIIGDGDMIPAGFLLEITFHDSGELITGDMPYTVKRDNPELAQQIRLMEDNSRRHFMLVDPVPLSSRWQALLKICDVLEGFIWCSKYENRSRIPDFEHTLDRYVGAYESCQRRFEEELTEQEWSRCNEIYQTFHPRREHK